MPTLHDFRADFSKGRTGPGLRVRQDTKAYVASVREAQNMMVLADGSLRRRWGTTTLTDLAANTRIESWSYAEGDTTEFLLAFSAGTLTIYDMTMAVRASFTGMPWSDAARNFLQVCYSGRTCYITDQTFRPRVVTFDPVAGTFSEALFVFSESADNTRIHAPFLTFHTEDPGAKLTIFTSKGSPEGYAGYIQTALGIDAGSFNLTNGTGTLTTTDDFFDAKHAGQRVRILDGEVQVDTVTDARTASVTVLRDVAKKLDLNPFYVRKGSRLVECAYPSHGQNVGDRVFFVGIHPDDMVGPLLTNAVQFASDGTTAAAPPDGAAAYTITRVLDADHFEFEAAGANAVVPTNSELGGGADVLCFTLDRLGEIREPAMSPLRGWPQACCVHERRLWLGGTKSLPDAVFGSRFFGFDDFDTGEGNPDDAVALYGIGAQARVRHLVSTFDLIILSDQGEHYIPGSIDRPITPETVRVVTSTNFGAAFTAARAFDGAVYFVEASGRHIREMTVESRDKEYTATPVSVVVADWIKGPHDCAVYAGAPNEATPYLIWANQDDGSLLVMHSSRMDNSFGFMRWVMNGWDFQSVAALGKRLFAVVVKTGGTGVRLLEFNTDADEPGMDQAEYLTSATPTQAWATTYMTSGAAAVYTEGQTYEDVELAGKTFTTSIPLTGLWVGRKMFWNIIMHPPIAASGQGPKAGKMQRLVTADIHWNQATTGEVEGTQIMTPEDGPELGPFKAADEWRTYYIGKWGREPTLLIKGYKPGQVGLRALTLNVYF